VIVLIEGKVGLTEVVVLPGRDEGGRCPCRQGSEWSGEGFGSKANVPLR
jgi:hypothetical protein